MRIVRNIVGTRRAASLVRWALALLMLAVVPVSHAAGFELEDLTGKVHRLEDYRGKWVLVNFWATWCSPCLTEIPELSSLHDAHKDKDLLVIGIALQSESPGAVAEFAKDHGITYPVVLGDFKMARQIGTVDVLPSSFLFDPKGEQVNYQAGVVTRELIENYLKNNTPN
jgi:thiol-disulfide isomerase/thioredoxin